FEPEQLERDAFPLQLLPQRRPLGQRSRRAWRDGWTDEQAGFELRLAELLRQWPRQSARREAREIGVHAALRQAETARDVALTQLLVKPEAQGLDHSSHGYPLSRHDLAPGNGPGG